MDALLIDIDRWESSQKIKMMDALEELGYFHLLLAEAKSEDCSLPDDDKQLAIYSKLGAQWLRVTRDPSKRILDDSRMFYTSGRKLRECFFAGATADPQTGETYGIPGRLYNSRVLQMHRSYLKNHGQRQKAAAVRWLKEKNPDAGAYASALHPQCNIDLDLDLDLNKENSTKVSQLNPPFGTLESVDDWFEIFWAGYWLKKAKAAAFKTFREHVKNHTKFNQIIAARDAQYPEMMRREPGHRPHAASWLNGERWNDEIAEPAAETKPKSKEEAILERI